MLSNLNPTAHHMLSRCHGRKREYKINNLRTEMDRISAKEKSEGGLTAGQASTMVRNEKAIEALTEEIEELDEQVNDSIRDSLSDKQKVCVYAGFVLGAAQSVERIGGECSPAIHAHAVSGISSI